MRVVMDWGIGSLMGWHNYGLNLALGFAGDPNIELRTMQPVSHGTLLLDPIRQMVLGKMLQPVGPRYGDVILHGLGNQIDKNPYRNKEKVIGIIFFEDPLSQESIENAKEYGLILTGSTWNEQILRSYGVSQVRTIFHGIDRTLFHPAARCLGGNGRFQIFSGGKAERRKGQDIIMAAFKIFAEKHKEALLVTAWQSPWPWLARTLDQSNYCASLVGPSAFTNDRLDPKLWARNCGINPDQVFDIGQVHNCMMPQVLREMDCAIFTNRAEGCTNYVAMECMACGVPTTVSANTGHLDLSCPDFLLHQDLDDMGRGESRVDEVVAAMDHYYENRQERAVLDPKFSIYRHCAQLKAAIMEVGCATIAA